MGDLAERRVGCLGGDAGELQGPGVDPHRVVVPGAQRHRPVGNGGIEPARIEQALGDEAGVVGRPEDPRRIGMLVGPAGHLRRDLLDAALAAHLRTLGLQASEHRVGVPVAESRDEPAVGDLVLPQLRYAARPPPRLGSGRDDPSVPDQEGIDLALGRAPQIAGEQQHLGHESSSGTGPSGYGSSGTAP